MRVTSLSLLLAGFMAMTASPAHAAKMHTIPFEITDTGHLVIDIDVNEQGEGKFILDTGATFPVMHKVTAAGAGISHPNDDRQVKVLGLAGVDHFPLIDVHQLSVGNIVLPNLQAAYNTKFAEPGEGNVLPASSLPYRVLDFDFQKREVTAYNSRPRRVRASTYSRLPVKRINNLPFIPIKMGGADAIALIDTGASVSFVNGAFANAIPDGRKTYRNIELIGSTGSVESYTLMKSKRFKMGDFRVDNFEVFVVDPELLKPLNLSDQPVMVIGLDILSQFRLQLDRDEQALLIHRPKKGVRFGLMALDDL